MTCNKIVPFLSAIILMGYPLFAQETSDSLSGGVNRAELAGALLRVEQCFYALDLNNEDKATYNKSFDDASLLFFEGDFPKALKALNDVVLAWQPEYKDHPSMPWLASLRIRVTPRVLALDSGTLPSIKFTQAYELPDATPPKQVQVHLTRYHAQGIATGELISLKPIELPENASNLDFNSQLSFPENGIPSGLYMLYLSDPDAESTEARWLTTAFAIVDSSLDETVAANKALLESIHPESPILQQAKIAIELRNNLLTDTPGDQKSTDYALDPNQLKQEITSEITALQDGKNPFAQRKGDYWRAFKTSVGKVPARVYAPDSLDLTQPVPLVIAFHGAGGDENMFLEAYGLGKIKGLADEHNFLLLSPLTYAFTGWTAGSSVKQVLDILKEEYPIDENRIYVLGHSMGGGATSALINAAPEIITAAACLCGTSALTPADNFPPTLLVAAELDPLAKPDRIKEVYNTAKENNLPVEFQLNAHYGHTLVVGDVLPEVITWLLKHN